MQRRENLVRVARLDGEESCRKGERRREWCYASASRQRAMFMLMLARYEYVTSALARFSPQCAYPFCAAHESVFAGA